MPGALFMATFSLAFLAMPEAPRPIHPLGRNYAEIVRKVNADHARRPGKAKEDDLAKRLPPHAKSALDKLLGLKAAPEVLDALVAAGEAALDLALAADFERIEARLREASPEHARRLGAGVFRARFIVRGVGDFAPGYLERFADLVEGILGAYDEVFGFEEWSKVPGKKLRFRVHLEAKITHPPHFAPQFPFHSEVDFPVADRNELRSPTPDGKFLFYGLCHELGHVLAMWGDRNREEDHHAWAHYTGIVIVEQLSRAGGDRPFLKGLGDVRWRSIEVEKKRLGETAPSLADRDGVLALLLALHDQVGPKAIAAALNALDREDRRPRINGVRYYGFKELKGALLQTVKGPEAKRAVAKLIPDNAPR